MFSALKKLATAGGVAALIRSPQGQQAIAKAKQMAADPANRQKVTDFAKKFGSKGTKGTH